MEKSSYRKLEKTTRRLYKSIGKIYCPCLGVKVIFNSKGFYHLKYNGLGRSRSVKERIYRMRLMPLAVPVIVNSKGPTSYKEEYSNKSMKYIFYLSLTAYVGKKSTPVKVV
ncbi:hypothetical protein ISR92_02170 [Patescibacteria group bacterium]|nr:hypothetical protein [Patescibacteria group bacterium]